MVFNICMLTLNVVGIWYLFYLGKSHVLVAMFDLVYYPGILGLFFIDKSGNWYLVQGWGSKVLTLET